MERPDRLRSGRQLLANQPYDESLEADDVDEAAGAYSQRQLDSGKRQRGLMSAHSGSFDYDEEPKSQSGSGTAVRQRAASPDEEDEDEEEDEDSDEEDSDESEPSRAPEGAYDPADYANLPVNTKIKELFQYITRYTPQSIELEHSLKPFIPEYIPAVGDIDAFLKVPRPDGKADDLGLLVLDEPSVKQSDPTVMSLWLSEDSKQHGTPEIKKVTSVPCPQLNPRPVDCWVDSISALHRSKPPASVQYSRPMPSIDSLMQEWPPELEELLQRHPPPTAALTCTTEQYADLICALLDIPVNNSRIQSLHLLFSLYLEFRGLQHFSHAGLSFIMATTGCVFHRTLSRSRPGPTKTLPPVCRELVTVLELQRYTRDQGSSVYFPQAVLSGADLYDITLSDGDCRLRVTLDPSLNQLVEKNLLRTGSRVRNATFASALAAQHPECSSRGGDSFLLVRLEVEEEGGGAAVQGRPASDTLPWFGSSEPSVPLVPLRANRSVFLPLWNNVDYSGEAWREAPPSEDEDGQSEQEEEEQEEEGRRPAVTVSYLHESFQLARSVVRGTVCHQLIVRVLNKSHLMYFGRAEQNCDCPYKAVIQVCDHTGSVCVVLWNSVCVSWYRRLNPGDIVSLSRYRVKKRFEAESQDIELSVNSRNPAARISVLAPSSVSPEHLPPAAPYTFYNSQELLGRPHGDVCDVIGLLTFCGRAERIRSREGGSKGEISEYRWLRLEDGSSDRPVVLKLFSTSQPEAQHKLHPMSVVVCTRLKVVRSADQLGGPFYLTNTVYTQVYCTGLGHHSRMGYRKLRPVQHFLQWLRSEEDGRVLNRAVVGGCYHFPPAPTSLESFMSHRQGKPGLVRGAEFQRAVERLCYRERQTLCIQATVTMVAHCRRGEEDCCLFWTHRASPWTPPSSSSLPASLRLSSSSSPHPSPSHSHSFSTSTACSPLSPPPPLPLRSPVRSSTSVFTPLSPGSGRLKTHHPYSRTSRKSCRRKLLQANAPCRKRPSATLQSEDSSRSVVLFQASMEFLGNEDGDTDDDEDVSFADCPQRPALSPVAPETLPMRYDHARREEQMAAVAMGGRLHARSKFTFTCEDYFTLRLKALSDTMSVDAVFLPDVQPSSVQHANTWLSILSHGAFSSHTLPPSPADLIEMASQLANQRLICVLEACQLGGATTEILITRGFLLEG